METMAEMVKQKTIKLQTSKENQIMTSNFKESINVYRLPKKPSVGFQRLLKLPVYYDKCTFENAKVLRPEEAEVKKQIEIYCEKFEEALKYGIGIYMYGKVGAGKTYYSLCVFNELEKQGYRVLRTSIKQIMKQIWEGFKDSKIEIEMYKTFKESDLIIIDDMGKEYINEGWGKSNLFEVFNFFEENQKCLIISTNLDTKQMQEYTDTLGSGAVFDRLKKGCQGIKFNWESRRADVNKEIFKKIFG